VISFEPASPGTPENPQPVLTGTAGLAFLAFYILAVPGIAASLGAWSAPVGWTRPGFACLAAVSAVAWAGAGLGIFAGVSRITGPKRPSWGSAAGKTYLFLTAAGVIAAHGFERPVERNLGMVLLGTALGWVLLIGFLSAKVFGLTPQPPPKT